MVTVLKPIGIVFACVMTWFVASVGVPSGTQPSGGDSQQENASIQGSGESEEKAVSTGASSEPDSTAEESSSSESNTYRSPEEFVAKSFLPPPGAKPLGNRRLWIDRKLGRVYVDGYVAMTQGPLEMFACPIGTKEHESIVATLARASDVHAALLAINAQSGTPVQFLPNFVPATGQRIRVWVCYWDDQNRFHAVDARRWVQRMGTKEHLESDWVFAGSGFWKDPIDGREYYRANSGDMICVSNFSTAMMDLPIASSAEADRLAFSPFTERIPPRGTPVRLVLVPIPIPTDQPDTKPKPDPNTPPTSEILPRPKHAAKPREDERDTGSDSSDQ